MGKREERSLITQKRLRVMSIVHGKSEYIFCKYVYSNLKLLHEIHSESRGKNSIQINSLTSIFEKSPFKSISELINKYPNIKYHKKENRIEDFRIFIIMDVDDCSFAMKEKFINKSLFDGHPLKDYICPIYNSPNLEAVMKEIKIKVRNKKDYSKIFPINNSGVSTISELRELCSKLRKSKNSNLYEFIEYCIEIGLN